MKIIGITGTIGAGKGTVVGYLTERKGFTHFSVRAFLIEIITARNMEVNRDSMVQVANELRASHSPSYLIESLYERARKAGNDCVIESIRTPGEVAALRTKKDFTLLAVDADPLLRYERIKLRGSETDMIDYDTFLANEQREMDADDPTKQNIRKCIALADYRIENNDSIEALFAVTEKILQQIEKKV
jgi:dephospho-CoA kinase